MLNIEINALTHIVLPVLFMLFNIPQMYKIAYARKFSVLEF
jgi:hypothetical protein